MLSAYPPRRLARRRGPTLFGGRAAHSLILLALLLGCCCGQSRAQNAPSLWGRPVTHLHLDCDCNLKLQNFPGAVTQQIGEPLDPAKVSESLKRLYATGRFSELRAEGALEGDGVSLTFVARAQYFIGIVTAEGNPGPIEARALVTASRLRLGQPLTDEELNAAHKRLSDLLVANGYYQSRITHEIERNPDTLEADVDFTIKAGPPARVSAVQFQDDSGFSSRAPDESFGLASAHVSDGGARRARAVPPAPILRGPWTPSGQHQHPAKGLRRQDQHREIDRKSGWRTTDPGASAGRIDFLLPTSKPAALVS